MHPSCQILTAPLAFRLGIAPNRRLSCSRQWQNEVIVAMQVVDLGELALPIARGSSSARLVARRAR
jgi:hypothetical protein